MPKFWDSCQSLCVCAFRVLRVMIFWKNNTYHHEAWLKEALPVYQSLPVQGGAVYPFQFHLNPATGKQYRSRTGGLPMLRCNRDGPLCFKISDTANQCRLRKRGRPMLWWKGDKEALNYDNLDEIKIELSLSYTFFWMTMTGKQCRLRTRRRPMLWCKGNGASVLQ